jgi:hypothetical protein
MGHNISNLRSGKKRIGEQKQMFKQSVLKIYFDKMGHSDNDHSPKKSKNSDGYRQGKD